MCDTITTTQMADRAFLPSSIIICLTKLLGNLIAWPGNKERDYELDSLIHATKLISEWERKLGEEDEGSDPAGPFLEAGGDEEERIVYCHFIRIICIANPFLIEMIVQTRAPCFSAQRYIRYRVDLG